MACGVNRAEKFYSGPRGRVCRYCKRKRTSLASREVRLAERYDITEADYLAILDAQGGVCAICLGTRPVNLDVDHDHQQEKKGSPARDCVRGLLCRRCNRRLLPAARDDIHILDRAIAYLRSPPARNILSAISSSDEIPYVNPSS